MIRSEKTFYRVLAVGLLLCAGLYAEEANHLYRYGWNSPDNDYSTRDMSHCKQVQGRKEDVECPVRGYGWARFRYIDHKDPVHNDIFFIDRNQ